MFTKWYSGELTTPNDRNSHRYIKQITLKTNMVVQRNGLLIILLVIKRTLETVL